MKLNKIICLFLLVNMLFFASCDMFYKYRGDEYDLFTVAMNSLLGMTGKSFRRPPVLEIKETDNYGRTLFYYYESDEVSRHHFIISQKSDSEFVYYYEDYNFISSSNIEISNDDIENLKYANDWNKPIDEKRLIKKKIVKKKKENSFKESEIEDRFLSIIGEEYFIHMVQDLTSNDKGQTITCVRASVRYEHDPEKYYVLIIDSNGIFDENSIMELDELIDYQEQLKQFKENNNWYSH